MEGVTYNFERSFQLMFLSRILILFFFYQNMHNLNKSAERKISQKNPEEMFIVMQQQFKFVHCDHAFVQSEWNEVIL
jgi:hypothetical protein